MNNELNNKLFNKYPKIFRQKDLPANQTCMCWGIECGDGWYHIINNLCSAIQHHVDWKQENDPNFPQIEAVQVKEKWGSLRFYTNYSDEYVDGLIDMAELVSENTCINCGSNDNVKMTNKGWIVPLCQKCYKE